MSGFRSAQTGDFDKYFMTTTDLIDRYANGGLWVWGNNQSTLGQLGDSTVISKSSPVQTIAGGTNWKQVIAGLNHTAGIKTDGTLWVWGGNTAGQLGNSTITARSSPVQTIAGGTNWKQIFLSDFGATIVAIKTDGTLWNWGNNSRGQLGDSTISNRSSPIQTIVGGNNWKQASGALLHTAAIKTDGTLWLWGDNTYGELGNSTVVHRSSPVQTIAGGTNWKQVSCGYYHTLAIKTDGTLWCWGHGGFGQLGDSNITTIRSSPVQTISGGTNWKQVAGGDNFTTAIKTDGTLWCFGRNTQGQLGDNTVTARSSPIQTIAGGTNWKQISGGVAVSVAIKTDGALWTWGLNNNGQLGDSTIISRSSPIQTIAGGTNWKSVTTQSHTVATQYSDIGQIL